MNKEERIQRLFNQHRMMKPNKNPVSPFDRGESFYEFVKKCIKPTDIVIEIGCFRGVSTEMLALHCKKLYGVDPYELGDNCNQDGGVEVIQWAENEMKQRMQEYDNFEHIKKMSNDACTMFEDGSIDVVYIDGDHRKKSVYYDILNYIGKIKMSGIIAGHDYHGHVMKMVRYMLGEPTKVFCDTSWMVHRNRIKDVNILRQRELNDL